MTGVDLAGGELSTVVRMGETVRRPTGPWTPAVHALLRHLEAAGFDGAPRAIGIDDQGREVLSYVDGRPALAPVPSADDVLTALGSLLRRMHDAQDGFVAPPEASWQRMVGAPEEGEVVCHNDLFWPNVVFRGGPVALIDWDLAAPGPRLHDLAEAASFWVPLRPDHDAAAWGLPTDRRVERFRLLCDGYELPSSDRARLLDAVTERTELTIATQRAWGRDLRLPGWAGTWDRDQDRYTVARKQWFERHRGEFERAPR